MRFLFIHLIALTQAIKVTPSELSNDATINPATIDTSPWSTTDDTSKFEDISQMTRKDVYQLQLKTQKFCSQLYADAKLNGADSVKDQQKIFINKLTNEKVVLKQSDCINFQLFDVETSDARSDRIPSQDFAIEKKFTPANMESSLISRAVPSQPNAFTINFTCNVIDVKICRQAKDAYTAATLVISQAIKFRHQIILDAKYLSFCTAKRDCSGSILGQASASSFWKMNANNDVKIDSFYWYPQALAKQLTPLGQSKAWAPSDIKAEFNHDSGTSAGLPSGVNRFWFRGEKNPITQKQYDFEYVILHEIMHGLGFSSSWSTYIPGASPDTYIPLVTPWYNFITQPDKSVIVDGCNALTIFDKFVYSKASNRSLTDSYMIMVDNGLATKGQPFKQWAKLFDKSAAVTEARKLYKYATTPGSLELRIGNDRIMLHTEYQKYRPGSSLTHVDQKQYTQTSTFLMRPEAKNGETLDEIEKSSGGNPIDDNLLKIFEALGYTINR